MRLRTIFVLGVLATLGVPVTASAHPLVDQAREQLGEALFVDALDTLATAEAGEDLTVEELADLFAVRALVNRALNNDDAMNADLARLAVVAPNYAFDRRAVPEVRRAFADARANASGAIRVVATPAIEGGGVTVRADAQNDVQHLVRTVRISGRPDAASAWERSDDAPLFVSTDGPVEYYVEAIGPGGAVLASSGSASSPHRFGGGGEAGGDVLAATGGETAEDDEGGGGAGLWIGLGIGLAVVAGVAIALAVALSSGGGESSQLDPFTVRF